MRLLVACTTLLLGALLGLLGGVGATASAQTPGTTPGANAPGEAAPKSVVAVVTVNGFIDPVLADFMRESISDANRVGATALIFQLDLQGSVIPDGELVALIAQM